MIINQALRKAIVLTFNDGLDDYGQPNKGVPTERPTEITFNVYTQQRVEDIRFVNVTHVALTFDREITDSNIIRLDGNDYSIELINPDGRLVLLYLKKV